MSENQTFLQLRGETLLWLHPASGAGGSDDSDHARIERDLSEPAHWDELRAQLQRSEHRVVFAVPGDDTRLLELDVAPEERRHLNASLPFMLEDSLSTDIESLHFAKLALDADRFGVAVVAMELMHAWSDRLGEFAGLLPWIPESLLLPWQENEWCLVVEGPSVLLRYGQCLGTRIEAVLLPSLLNALVTECPPKRILVYGKDENEDRGLLESVLLAGVPEAAVEWRRGGLASAAMLSSDAEASLNLLQGSFAPRLPYTRWWDAWRAIAALVLTAVVLHLLSGWLDYRQLSREDLALRGEIQAVYRQLNPRGAISNVERQLNQQLAELRGDDGGGSFTGLLAPLGEVMASDEETLLASLNYSRRTQELRVNLLSSSFSAVEGVREELVKKGHSVDLENSTRSGDRVRARLRIAARPGVGS
ncbi:MAG: type II secretion system protein GspL [Congregibacter sp.]